MITLTRENGQPVLLNADLIETVERTERPDESIITLTTGNVVIVRETLAEIEANVVAFKRKIYGPKEPGA